MPSKKSPRHGSLQFWPKTRAKKFLPRVNWNAINSGKNLKGFICYKAGMTSLMVLDSTPNSMTKGKKIMVPATIIECPPLKIYSIRFYKNGIVAKEILNDNVEKEMKRKVKFSKSKHSHENVKLEEHDDVKIIAYSQVKKTGIKKTPDVVEIGLTGTKEEKYNFAKENLHKEINASEFFSKGQLIDLRGLTTGKGNQGPVKRMGITLKSHKSEKGQRNVGSIGPWHPRRSTFRTPHAGQLGMFSRVVYNNKIISIGKVTPENEGRFKGIKNYGDVKTEFVIVYGSVQGPAKRQLVMTSPLRETKRTKKKMYEIVEAMI